jgi:benzoate/toluate 1,2-dioxygenase subunit beta
VSDASGSEPLPMSRTLAEDLLYQEAAYLDDRDLEGWLTLFTDDARYWLPMDVEAPATEPSLVYDDRARMGERVFRLLDTPALAQLPPSRTQHDVTNVRVLQASARQARIAAHLVVHEGRIGDVSQVGLAVPRVVAGRCVYDLRLEGARWLIAAKTVRLLTRELPQFNLTFVI